ncbi:MAG: TonB-dependent receptor [Pseudomonadota bacterium]
MRVALAAIAGPCLSVALSVPFSTALAEEAKSLDKIVVNATRLGQSKTETGSSVSVITADDIEAMGAIYVLDALAQAPGVTINQNGAFGGNASVRIRGAATEQTLVLIDGVPVNDTTSPGGGFNFARLDTANIERIEILKGPQSTLWGTDAIGGVIAITTKTPDGGLGGDVFVEGGSFSTVRGGGSISNGNDKGDFRIGAVAVSSDGISKADEANGNSEDDSFDSLTLTAKGGLNLGQARLSADVLYTDAETEFDSFSFGSPGSVADGDELSDTEELAANVTLTFPALDGRLENLLQIGYSDIDRENFTNGASSFGSEGDRQIYRYLGTYTTEAGNRLAFGAEREDTTANDDDTSIDGLFALYEFKVVDGLTTTAGVRYDDHDRFGSETTLRVASAWALSDRVTVRASWGEGFKAPTIFQTTFFCCGATAPNADLEPETSAAFDAGVDWQSADGRYDLGATVFRQDTENLINFDFLIGGYLNIDEVLSTGVELSGSVALTDTVRLSLDYAYIDAQDGNGDPLARLPEHSGDLSLSYQSPGALSGNLLVRYNGSETNTDGTTLDGWWRVDVTGRYAFNERIEAYGRIENLFDEEYQQILGYGTPGVSGTVGIRSRF